MIYLGNSPVGVAVDALGSLLEIVDHFTAEENSDTHVFNFDGKRGGYIIVSNPPGNLTNGLDVETPPGAGVLNMSQIRISGNPITAGGSTITIRSNMASSGYFDNWTLTATVSGNELTVNVASTRKAFVAGWTYYLIRVKGM